MIYSAVVFGMILFPLISFRADSTIPQPVEPRVEIVAESGRQITYRTQNGSTAGGEPSESREIPYLVLRRNGKLTPAWERSLTITVEGFNVPSSGAYVSLSGCTQHEAPVDELGLRQILVWRETRWIPGSASGEAIRFAKTFTDLTIIHNKQFSTPTDYFNLDLHITDQPDRLSHLVYEFHQEYAFLIEDQWLVELPNVHGDFSGAAPGELLLYYYDMLPFHDTRGGSQFQIPRAAINEYLVAELIPAMQAAFLTESEHWGLRWHPEWRSYRPEDPPNRLSVALTDGSTWYHGQVQARGSGAISLRVNSEDNDRYQDLTDSLMSTFYHELFHNLQRGISLSFKGDGDVDGIDDAWQFFSEGTAVLATSVGQPEVQFSRSPQLPVYFLEANGFFAGGGAVERDLNRSYEQIDPYHAAIYWRFMYEKCGGMTGKSENPRLGMQIIRNALHVLYSKTVVDIQASPELVENLPAIMDLAIQLTGTCPFDNYRDSLVQFSRAVYLLQLENGRCVEPGQPPGCELYDPDRRYLQIPIPEFTYAGDILTVDGTAQPFPDGIKSSFGMDFLEIHLADVSRDVPFTIRLASPAAKEAEFALQVLKIDTNRHKGLIPGQESQVTTSDIEAPSHKEKMINISVQDIESSSFDRLGLIITRLDNDEKSDSLGEYSIKIYPDIGLRSD